MGPQGWQQKVRQTEAQAQAANQAFVAEAKRQGMGMFTELTSALKGSPNRAEATPTSDAPRQAPPE